MIAPLAKPVLSLLNRLFAAEATRAVDKDDERKGWPLLTGLRQTKAMQQAIDLELIEGRSVRVAGRMSFSLHGYELTRLGRSTYCASCDPVPA